MKGIVANTHFIPIQDFTQSLYMLLFLVCIGQTYTNNYKLQYIMTSNSSKIYNFLSNVNNVYCFIFDLL